MLFGFNVFFLFFFNTSHICCQLNNMPNVTWFYAQARYRIITKKCSSLIGCAGLMQRAGRWAAPLLLPNGDTLPLGFFIPLKLAISVLPDVSNGISTVSVSDR